MNPPNSFVGSYVNSRLTPNKKNDDESRSVSHDDKGALLILLFFEPVVMILLLSLYVGVDPLYLVVDLP